MIADDVVYYFGRLLWLFDLEAILPEVGAFFFIDVDGLLLVAEFVPMATESDPIAM